MKKRICSIKKGKRGELQVATVLNDFYKTKAFKRIPQSGAFGTIHYGNLSESEAKVFVGDIITPDWWPFIIEVKNIAKIDLYKIFSSGKCEWDEQLKQEEKQLDIAKKKGVILIFKATRKEWLVMLKSENFPKIKFVPKIELEGGRMIVPLEQLLKITLKNLNIK